MCASQSCEGRTLGWQQVCKIYAASCCAEAKKLAKPKKEKKERRKRKRPSSSPTPLREVQRRQKPLDDSSDTDENPTEGRPKRNAPRELVIRIVHEAGVWRARAAGAVCAADKNHTALCAYIHVQFGTKHLYTKTSLVSHNAIYICVYIGVKSFLGLVPPGAACGFGSLMICSCLFPAAVWLTASGVCECRRWCLTGGTRRGDYCTGPFIYSSI